MRWTRAPAAWLGVLCGLPLLAAVQLALVPPAAAQSPTLPFDPEHTRFEFELRTRWGQRIVGDFPRYDGGVTELPDGRRRVEIRLDAAAVEVRGSPRYTGLARGENFFDAARHPVIEFRSEPYSPELLLSGGPLRGRLTIRGVSGSETFELSPAACARAARDCDVRGRGTVRREDYGLDTWMFALGNRVQFGLRVRVREPAP